MKVIDLVGQKFYRLTVTVRGSNTNQGQARWECQCECGNTCAVGGAQLRSGHTRSCGCLHREMCIERSTKHGHTTNGITPTYHTWTSMIARCESSKNKRYADWGGRGIRVCGRWHDFSLFLADMGEKPMGMSIDRVDNNGNYEPGNCRWATLKEQNNNRRPMRQAGLSRRSRFLEFNGERLILADWSRKTGVPASTILVRLGRGWSVDRALSTPVPA